jgi:hypothetical protein
MAMETYALDMVAKLARFVLPGQNYGDGVFTRAQHSNRPGWSIIVVLFGLPSFVLTTCQSMLEMNVVVAPRLRASQMGILPN